MRYTLRHAGLGIAVVVFLTAPFSELKWTVPTILVACFCCLFDIANKEG